MSELTKHYITRKLEFNNKIIQKGGDGRIYRECILLTPGSWTDSLSMIPTEYTDEHLSISATNWEENFLNVNHSHAVQDRIGYVMNTYWYNNAVMGDIHIYPITQMARDSIALIDAGMINELSVELLSNDQYDEELGKVFATDITYFGAAVVSAGACRQTKITDNPNYQRGNY